jgi:hypothetical protein
MMHSFLQRGEFRREKTTGRRSSAAESGQQAGPRNLAREIDGKRGAVAIIF